MFTFKWYKEFFNCSLFLRVGGAIHKQCSHFFQNFYPLPLMCFKSNFFQKEIIKEVASIGKNWWITCITLWRKTLNVCKCFNYCIPVILSSVFEIFLYLGTPLLFKIIRGLKYLFREKYEEESKKGPGLEQLVSNEELEKVVNFLKRLKDTVEDNLSTGGEKVSPFNINFRFSPFKFHIQK